MLDLGAPGNTLSFTTGGLLLTGNNNYTIQDGTLGASGAELDIHQYSSGTLTVSGPISGGAGSLVKDGPGTLILSGTSTYTGTTYLNGGILSTGAAGTLGNTAVSINGGTLQATGSFALTSSAPANLAVTLGGGGGTFDITGSNTLTVGGVISGIGSLNQTDTGTLILNGANTFSGGTFLNGGTLSIAADSALGATPSNSVANLTFNGGTLALTGTNVALNANRAVQVAGSTATFNVAASTTTNVPGNITGTGGLTKSGSGTLVVGNLNTYSGTTNITAGTLQLPAMPTGAVLNYNFTPSTVSGSGNGAILTNVANSSTFSATLTWQRAEVVGPSIGYVSNADPTSYVMNLGTAATGTAYLAPTGLTLNGTYTMSVWFSGFIQNLGAGTQYNTLFRGTTHFPLLTQDIEWCPNSRLLQPQRQRH